MLDLSTFIVAVLCLIDDRIADLGRLRGRGPAPTLCDSMPSFATACLFARAYRCKRFRAEAAFGKEARCSSRPSTASGCT